MWSIKKNHSLIKPVMNHDIRKLHFMKSYITSDTTQCYTSLCTLIKFSGTLS